MSSPPSEVTAGVDLGGTGTRIVVLDRHGVVLHQVSRPTPASSAGAVSGLVSSIAAATAGHRLRGVGIGASGPVDSLGIIRNTETLPAFSDIQITPVISERLGVPCVIDNDAVVAAVGEHACGAGRDSAGLLVVTLGTGVGVAALTGGRPFRGADGGHPEAGHIPVGGPRAPCYCGLPSCWEQLASRAALDHLTGNDTEALAAKARGGDVAAAQMFDTYGERVGTGLLNTAGHLPPRPGRHRRRRGAVHRPVQPRPAAQPRPRPEVHPEARRGRRGTGKPLRRHRRGRHGPRRGDHLTDVKPRRCRGVSSV
jgi:glucokinase